MTDRDELAREKCPVCDGRGYSWEYLEHLVTCKVFCFDCNGTGWTASEAREEGNE